MMGERQVHQNALFYQFSLERHVPGDHLLWAISRTPSLTSEAWGCPELCRFLDAGNNEALGTLS
jgi:hypothetical protein